MCGIAGIFNRDGKPASGVVLKRMADAIAHRGPDGEGIVTDGDVGFAHRRLAIIDLSPAAHQPMASTDGRYLLTYNGELYNFRELRAELEALGHQFRSRTDSEVVLEAFAEWGANALNRFNGMFAFAVWDNVRRELFLARDRYGIKPLYYTWAGDRFLFGSEVKALVVHPDVQCAMDPEGLLEYFTFQNIFTDRTLFAGVRLLPAGTHMTVKAETAPRPEPVRYWDFAFREPEHVATEQEYVEELDRLLTQAVSRQLVSDVEIGAYLSGGMDSGAITALAARELPYMKSFTVGFDLSSASGVEMGYDERAKAEQMSYLFKTEQYQMVLKAGDMQRAMPTLAWHLEEPRVGQSYPNYYAAKLAGKFVKVVLAGTGADELFGGYPWRYYRAAVNNNFTDYVDKYYQYWQRLLDNSVLRRVFSPVAEAVGSVWTRDIFENVFTEHPETLGRPEDYINYSLYFEAKTFLHGLLVVEDKLSMAHGLETRVPFLDNDLVDFAMQVPCRLKLGNLGEIVRLNENEPGRKTTKYFDDTRDGKLLLRKAMSKYIPKTVTERRKQGFSAPDASWFRGESIDYVRSVVLDDRSELFQFLDPDSIRELVREHFDGKTNRRLLIWSLICVEEWCKQFLGGEKYKNTSPYDVPLAKKNV